MMLMNNAWVKQEPHDRSVLLDGIFLSSYKKYSSPSRPHLPLLYIIVTEAQSLRVTVHTESAFLQWLHTKLVHSNLKESEKESVEM